MSAQLPILGVLLEASSAPAFVADARGRIASANRALEQLLGYEAGELEGRALTSLLTLPGHTLPREARCGCTAKDGRRHLVRATAIRFEADEADWDLVILRAAGRERRPSLEGRFQDAILDIARAPEIASGDFQAAAKRVVRAAAETLDVERVSVWLLVDGGATLECVTLFELTPARFSGGVRLLSKDYPAYFEALEGGRAIAADDAPNDPATHEFSRGYLDAHGITSMLDSVIRVSGEVIGVVCHEHVGPARAWRDEEVVFASELADQVASAFLVAKNRETEDARSTLEAELRQAQKLEAIGRLAGGVAHDFNNLLSVILGYTELARSMGGSPELQSCLGEIQSAGNRAADLTNQLLSIGRRQVLQTRPVDLNDLVGSALELLRRVIPENIEIEFEPSPAPATVLADPGQLDQVIMNLCLNARDATRGGGRIRLSVHVDHGVGHEESWVVMGVADDGIGIAPDVLERVFDPFFTTKEEGRGTGLGLSTVYGIARQHGGHVEVKSELGRGTRVEVRLPYAPEGDGSASETGEHVLLPVRAPQAGGEHILVAEDAEPIRDLLRTILVSAGYRVTLAVDGTEAVELHEQLANDIDVVVLDVIMPRRSGRAAFDAIREHSPDVPVIFMTGYGDNALSPEVIEEPDVQVLQKPCRTEVILAAVRAAVVSGREPAAGGLVGDPPGS
jgi:PAS domain S-box-containing protein